MRCWQSPTSPTQVPLARDSHRVALAARKQPEPTVRSRIPSDRRLLEPGAEPAERTALLLRPPPPGADHSPRCRRAIRPERTARASRTRYSIPDCSRLHRAPTPEAPTNNSENGHRLEPRPGLTATLWCCAKPPATDSQTARTARTTGRPSRTEGTEPPRMPPRQEVDQQVRDQRCQAPKTSRSPAPDHPYLDQPEPGSSPVQPDQKSMIRHQGRTPLLPAPISRNYRRL